MTRILALALVLALAPVASARGEGWRPVAAAPIAPSGYLASAWTGEELVVFGRTRVGGRSRNVAAAYTPRTGRWRRLAPPAGPAGSYEGTYSATWTGEEVLLVGNGAILYRKRLEELGKGVEFASPASGSPHASALVELAVPRFLREEFDRPYDVVPLYLRKSDAEIGWDKRARAG